MVDSPWQVGYAIADGLGDGSRGSYWNDGCAVWQTKISFVGFHCANCAGSVIARSPGVTPGECVFLGNGISVKSISYSGVPNQTNFYESGGQNGCPLHGPILVTGSGSGCATGPPG